MLSVVSMQWSNKKVAYTCFAVKGSHAVQIERSLVTAGPRWQTSHFVEK